MNTKSRILGALVLSLVVSACDGVESPLAPGSLPIDGARFSATDTEPNSQDAPTGVAISGSGSSLALSWTAVGGTDTRYKVQYCSTATADCEAASTFETTGTTHLVPDLAAGAYRGRVKTVATGSKWSGFSGEFTRAAAQVTAPVQTVTIAFDAATLSTTYSGGAQEVLFSLSAPVSATITYNGSTTLPTDAGTYAVLVTVTQSGYTGSASAELVIQPATLTVDIGTSRVVLGSELPCSASFSGWVGNEGADLLSGAAECTTAGSPSTASGAGNYSLVYGGGVSAGRNYTLAAGDAGTITAHYVGTGFLQPILANGTRTEFKNGSKIPLKFRLSSTSGSVTNAVAQLTVNGTSVGAPFRYSDGQYIHNFETKGSGLPTNQDITVVATTDDGVTVFSAKIFLKN